MQENVVAEPEPVPEVIPKEVLDEAKAVWTEEDDCKLIDNYPLLKDLDNGFSLLGQILNDPLKTREVVCLGSQIV